MPQNWIPPDYAEPVAPVTSDWMPPDYAEPINVGPDKEDTGQSALSKLWDKTWTSLAPFTPELKAAQESFRKEHPIVGALGNLGLGLMEATTSPGGLALTGLTGGANLAGMAAAKYGIPGLAKVAAAMNLPGRLAGMGMVGHGGARALGDIGEFYNQPSWEKAGEITGELGEAGLGALGLRGLRGNLKTLTEPLPPVYERDWLGPKQLTTRIPESPVSPDNVGFISGDRGLAENRPYRRSTTEPFAIGTEGNLRQPARTITDLGEIIDVTPEIAAQYGLQPKTAPIEEVGPITDRNKLLGPAPSFIAGARGVAKNEPQVRSTIEPFATGVEVGGTRTLGDIGEVLNIPPDIAAQYGLSPQGAQTLTSENLSAIKSLAKILQDTGNTKGLEKLRAEFPDIVPAAPIQEPTLPFGDVQFSRNWQPPDYAEPIEALDNIIKEAYEKNPNPLEVPPQFRGDRTTGQFKEGKGGLSSLAKPTATYIGTQPGFEDLPETKLYNIKGGPLDGDTVSAETLKRNGIEVPSPKRANLFTDETGALIIQPDVIRAWFKKNIDKFKNDEEFSAGQKAVEQENWQRAARVMEDKVDIKGKEKFIKSLGTNKTKEILNPDYEITDLGDNNFGVINTKTNEVVWKTDSFKDAETTITQLTGRPSFLERLKGEEGEVKINRSNVKPNKDRKRQPPVNSTARTKINANAKTALDKLRLALQNAAPIRAMQEDIYSAERAKRIAKAEDVIKRDPLTGDIIRGGGVEGFYKQKGKLAGEYPKVDFAGMKLNQKDTDSLVDAITISPYLLPWEKIRAKDGLLKVVTGSEVPQKNELRLLGEVFGGEFLRTVTLYGGLGGPISKQMVMEQANAMKSIMASTDVSAPLRQGLPLIYRDEWRNALVPMFRSLVSKDYYNDLMQAIKDRPKYLLGQEANLALTVQLDENEEAYMASWADILPIVSQSEHAYVGFLNKLRADVFDNMIDQAESLGTETHTIDEKGNIEVLKPARDIADFVNNSTGRGRLPTEFLRKNAAELNIIFFSPKMIASRLNMLNPKYYMDLDPFVRKEALKALFTVAAVGATVTYLMKQAGAKVEENPTNADFGKPRFGNTRLDPYGGFQQYIVLANRLARGEITSSTSNKTRKFGEGFNAPNILNTLGRFGENKLSPMGSFVDGMLSGKDFLGNPFNPSKEIVNRYTPMLIGDMIDLYKEDPDTLPLGLKITLGGLAAGGMSLQTYEPANSSPFKLSIKPMGKFNTR